MDFSEHFYYDETSPTGLRWARDSYCGKHLTRLLHSTGDVAGSDNKDGYYTVKVGNKSYRVHRIIVSLLFKNLSPQDIVDHYDNNGHNNKKENLRVVTNKINLRNAGMSKNNTSGKTGVNFDKHTGGGVWKARWVTLDGKLRSKCFNVSKFGYDTAFALACDCRDEMIAKLNEQGAGYTESHGL